MGRIVCFFLEPTEEATVRMRRFGRFGDCGRGYHDASVTIGTCHFPLGNALNGEGTDIVDRGDPRWPTTCERCGALFAEDHDRQLFKARLYRRSDTGELTTLREAPPGAMWFADWMRDAHRYNRGPDGHVLVVMTPAGEWCVDGAANNGPGWTREGTPPNVTARPSILIDGWHDDRPVTYHAFLTNGVLEDC